MKKKILIVEDERPLAEMIRIKFPPETFDARTACTGPDALKQVEAFKPDLILLDVMMGGMDGWEVLSHLKASEATAAIPVIMCTAREGEEDIHKSFKSGAQAYIIKPISFPKLLHKVTALLDLEDVLRS